MDRTGGYPKEIFHRNAPLSHVAQVIVLKLHVLELVLACALREAAKRMFLCSFLLWAK